MNDDFLFMEEDWMYKEFAARLELVRSVKYYTFKAALNLLLQRTGGPGIVIVETGTMRVKDDPGGCSTLLFAAFAQRYQAHLYTVDNSAEHMEVAKEETKQYADHVTYALQDSIQFFKNFKGAIHLLYLDSFDCDPKGDSTISQMHQMQEFEEAKWFLNAGSILLLDDNNFPSGGKTRILKHYLATKPEWELILDAGQSLWQKRA